MAYQALINPSDMVVTGETLAQIIGISARRVRELRDQGRIPDTDGGQYVLGDAVRAYCAGIRPASGQAAAGGSALGDDDDRTTLTEERTMLTRAQREAQEFKNQIAQGEFVKADEVEHVWSDFLRNLRSRVMAVPSRVRQIIPTLTAHDAALIDRELRDVLTGLANGDG